MDIVRDDDFFTIRAGLPGMAADDIETIDDGILVIKAETKHEDQRQSGDYLVRERQFGAFRRAVRLPDNVDADQAEPRYENGVLTVTLPVAETRKPKQLKVSTAEAPSDAS